jgi:hypothetical protein
MGRWGWDSPQVLVWSAIDQLADIDANPEYILITGDFVGHFVANAENGEPGSPKRANY